MRKVRELYIPFSWSERRSVLLERFLYIPGFYEGHALWRPIPWVEIFGNEFPICVEYCSGNGQWIAEQAKENPQKNWVAVEKRFDRARKIWARSFRENLSNLFIVCGEGVIFSRHYAPEDEIAEVFVNFPDPWPKKRHAKNRLVRAEFIRELSRIGKKGAKAMFVTDDEAYASQMTEEISQCAEWHPLSKEKNRQDYGDSFFADLWREKGRAIYHLSYELAP